MLLDCFNIKPQQKKPIKEKAPVKEIIPVTEKPPSPVPS